MYKLEKVKEVKEKVSTKEMEKRRGHGKRQVKNEKNRQRERKGNASRKDRKKKEKIRREKKTSSGEE